MTPTTLRTTVLDPKFIPVFPMFIVGRAYNGIQYIVTTAGTAHRLVLGVPDRIPAFAKLLKGGWVALDRDTGVQLSKDYAPPKRLATWFDVQLSKAIRSYQEIRLVTDENDVIGLDTE